MRSGRARTAWLIAAALLLGGCTADRAGEATIAAFALRPIGQVRAEPLPPGRTVAGELLLGFSPDGTRGASVDAGGTVCVHSLRSGTRLGCVATDVPRARISASFAPDGTSLAVGDVGGATGGEVWVLDLPTGRAAPVPPVPGVAPPRPGAGTTGTGKSGGSSGGAPPSAARSGGAWVAMEWDGATGRLVLVNLLLSTAGPTTRVVDFDRATGISRQLGLISGPRQGVAHQIAVDSGILLTGVFSQNQIRPDLVAVALSTGQRHDLGQIAPPDTSPLPLAVGPDGRRAVLGTGAPSSVPARLIATGTGAITPIAGVSGDVTAAAYAPDGRTIALVATAGARSVLWLARADGGGRARRVGELVGRVPRGTQLNWSRLGVVAATGSGGGLTAAVIWRLS